LFDSPWQAPAGSRKGAERRVYGRNHVSEEIGRSKNSAGTSNPVVVTY